MADAKLSELTAATTAAASDTLYLVQSSTSKKITVANFFASVATPVVFTDKIQIQDSDTITAAGAISVATNLTKISNPSGSGTLTIAAGSEGQLKIIIMIANTGGHTLTLSDPDVQGTIAFSAVGKSATLLYTNSKWYFIGGTAVVS